MSQFSEKETTGIEYSYLKLRIGGEHYFMTGEERISVRKKNDSKVIIEVEQEGAFPFLEKAKNNINLSLHEQLTDLKTLNEQLTISLSKVQGERDEAVDRLKEMYNLILFWGDDKISLVEKMYSIIKGTIATLSKEKEGVKDETLCKQQEI